MNGMLEFFNSIPRVDDNAMQTLISFSAEWLLLILCFGLSAGLFEQDSPCYEVLLADRRRVPQPRTIQAWRLAGES